MNNYSKAQLKKIFTITEKTLYSESLLAKKQLDLDFKPFKTLHKSSKTFHDAYAIILYVTFYSGFKATIVNKKLDDINRLLGNYEKVDSYKSKEIKALMKNNKIIKHENKIRACIFNAQQIKKMSLEFGTFTNYLKSFGNLDDEKALNKLIKDLRRRFKYLGKITVYHFLMDLGLNVVKPDRVLCRIFYRLGLISSITDYSKVIDVGRRFALATGHPIRYIDIIFVFYGQVKSKYELDLTIGICLEKKPKCFKCGIIQYCDYYNNSLKL